MFPIRAGSASAATSLTIAFATFAEVIAVIVGIYSPSFLTLTCPGGSGLQLLQFPAVPALSPPRSFPAGFDPGPRFLPPANLAGLRSRLILPPASPATTQDFHRRTVPDNRAFLFRRAPATFRLLLCESRL